MPNISTIFTRSPSPATASPTQVAPTTPGQPLSPTQTLQRHPRVGNVVQKMAQSSRSGGASSTRFLAAKGTSAESWAFSYHTGQGKRLNIQAAPKDGVVRGTVVINASGHAGGDTGKQFAKTNTYSVRITLPDGEILERNHIPRNNPTSEEYATAIDIEFPYRSGVSTLEAWPDGSARTGGYVEGRKYSIHSHDKAFDVTAQRAKAKAYKDQHPEVRWGTRDEHADVEKARIAPAPLPYQER
jgi:hypothetical protein